MRNVSRSLHSYFLAALLIVASASTCYAQANGNAARGFEYTPLDAGREAYEQQRAIRSDNINRQIGVNAYVRWLATLPSGLATDLALPGARIYGPYGGVYRSQIYWPGSFVNGDTVFEPYGSMPPYAGTPYVGRVAQPSGYEIIPKKNGGYYYGPTYGPPKPAAPPLAAFAADQQPLPPQAQPLQAQPQQQPFSFDQPREELGQPQEQDDQQLATLRGLFADGKYEQVLQRSQQMAASTESLLLQIQALNALGEFDSAGKMLSGVLPNLPQDEWGLIVRNYQAYYGSSVRFTATLRNLEGYLNEHKNSGPARLLLGYQYGCLGFADEAARQLEIAAKLAPQDKAAPMLLEMLQRRPAEPLPQPPQAGERQF